MADTPITASQAPLMRYDLPTNGSGVLSAMLAGGADASTIPYTPANAADWGTTPPTTVAQALDKLADVNAATERNAAPITVGAGTAAFDTAAITSVRSGVYYVVGTVRLDTKVAPTEGINLRVDGASISASGVTFSLSGTDSITVCVTLAAVISVNPAVTHTFGIQSSSGSGKTIAINQAQISWREL